MSRARQGSFQQAGRCVRWTVDERPDPVHERSLRLIQGDRPAPFARCEASPRCTSMGGPPCPVPRSMIQSRGGLYRFGQVVGHNCGLTTCLRICYEDEDLWLYFEADDEGWAVRQVEALGQDWRRVPAASLEEALA